jgi:hypothetical protein
LPLRTLTIDELKAVEDKTRSESPVSTQKPMEFPRVNFVAVLAAALSLISVFIDWWGVNITGSFTDSSQWSLWGGPSTIYFGSGSAHTLTTYSPLIGILVGGSAAMLLLGIIPKAYRLLIVGSVLAVTALIFYVIILNSAVSTCNGEFICVSGISGSKTSTVGLAFTVNWGLPTRLLCRNRRCGVLGHCYRIPTDLST